MKRESLFVVVGLGIYAMVPAACTVEATDTGSGGAASSTASNTVATATVTTGPVAQSSSTGSLTMTEASCDAPGTSPSKGACAAPSKPDCSDLNGGGGAGGGGAGTGGGGGAPSCVGIIAKPTTCTTCVSGACCADLAACDGIPNCVDCFFGVQMDQKLCGTPAITAASEKLFHCTECECGDECLPKSCNPVTNAPCDTAAGESCDFGSDGFVCYPAPNDAKLCEECDQSNGPYCAPGHTCLEDGGCAKYCCDDGDCGTGTCQLYKDLQVGTCVKK